MRLEHLVLIAMLASVISVAVAEHKKKIKFHARLLWIAVAVNLAGTIALFFIVHNSIKGITG